MKNKKNQSGLRHAIGLIRAGYPVYQGFFAIIIAKLTRNTELVAELEENYQSMVDTFIEFKADKARLRELSAEKRRAMKKLDKYCRKIRKIVKQEMPKEKWPEFGIDDEK